MAEPPPSATTSSHHLTAAATPSASTPASPSSLRSRTRKPKTDNKHSPAKPSKDTSSTPSPSAASSTTTAQPTASASTVATTTATDAPASAKAGGGRRSRSEKVTNAAAKPPKTKAKTKVVIRRLPPNVPEPIFWNSVSTWVRDAAQAKALDEAARQSQHASTRCDSFEATVDYRLFIPGKLKADLNKENVCSRAYVRFLDPAVLVEFHKHFDGHVFRDSKGNESIAVVEFAPYQKMPTERRRKPDARQGTIEADADYKAFLDGLEAKQAQQTENRTDAELMAHLTQSTEKVKDPSTSNKSTPLLDHLRSLKAARAESAAIAAARSYKNPHSYQYPDDRSKGATPSSSRSASRKSSTKSKTSDPASSKKSCSSKKGEMTEDSTFTSTPASSSTVTTATGKNKSAKAAGGASGRAFGAALSGALRSAGVANAKASTKDRNGGKGKEKAKEGGGEDGAAEGDKAGTSKKGAASTTGERSKTSNTAEASAEANTTKNKTISESKEKGRGRGRTVAAATTKIEASTTKDSISSSATPSWVDKKPPPPASSSSASSALRREKKPKPCTEPTSSGSNKISILKRDTTAKAIADHSSPSAAGEATGKETKKDGIPEKDKVKRRRGRPGLKAGATTAEGASVPTPATTTGKASIGQAIWD